MVTLTGTPGNQVYYTLDGSDPRTENGAIAANAILYTGPIALSQSTQVTARVKGTPPASQPTSNSSYPGNESPNLALDGLAATKYLNFGKENSGLIIKPTSGASTLRSMIITTANDATERDPASYVLYGTNAAIVSADNSTGLGETWTEIASGTLSLTNTRLTDSSAIAIPNSTAYTAYKILFPTLKNAASAAGMQIANIKLFPTSNGTGAQIQSASDLVRAVHLGLPSTVGGSEWSERTEGLFSVESPANSTNLRVTELHYHPANPTAAELLVVPTATDSNFEFIELQNISSSAISLNNVSFTGITFNFNTSSFTSLQPGATVLLVSDPVAFQARYGTEHPVAGHYMGQLSNGGEQIVVLDAQGQPIQDFTFDDIAPWPLSPDGGGPSLEIVDTAGSYSSGTNWRASIAIGGSPVRNRNSPATTPATTSSTKRTTLCGSPILVRR